ncbi:MAG: hypothetical protein FD189_1422 [Elusimicrobia bacterium]|nr:MAG: hypothetical protein FD154_1702 [Elusimicrobiota bacterium]KAF0155403.1 MAG: hypothetical protein FD189_1422 [Elusimicrobiota bacterium]
MKKIPLFLPFLFLTALSSAAKPPAVLPPLTGFTAADMPGDAGGAALLRWDSPGSAAAGAVIEVYVSDPAKPAWVKLADFKAEAKSESDFNRPFWAWSPAAGRNAVRLDTSAVFGRLDKPQELDFKLRMVRGAASAETEPVRTVIKGNWFNAARLNNFLLMLAITIGFFWTVSHARRKGLFIRRIAGLDAIDEAIGRATEMGRPIFYSTGIGQMSLVPTIASTSILGEVARKVAQYDTQLKVPHFDPIVMTVCKEVVKQSYLEMERPDSYRDDINFFVSNDQFSYAASVDGMIHREKPAACFFIGHFMAESLLLAEVGATTGAIQIAGTEQESQLPFFFTSCDYTLIGEELYAAGAYLSKEPMLLSTLKVQDFGKAFVMVSVVAGSILLAAGAWFGWQPLIKVVEQLFKAY